MEAGAAPLGGELFPPHEGSARLPAWVSPFLLCSCVRMGVFSNPGSSLEDRAFAFAWVPSAFHVPGSAPLDV